MRAFLVLSLSVAGAAFAAADTLTSVLPSGLKEPNSASIFQPSGLRDGLTSVYAVSGTPSHNAQGDPGNTVVVYDLAAAVGLPSGTPVAFNGIGWDVTLFADVAVGPFGGSWLSEVSVGFSADGDTTPDIFLSPGAGSNFSGTAPFTSGGVVKLGDVAIPDIALPNGLLRMEFHESFDDDAGFDDGRWVNGGLTLQVVPEPASLGLLVLGGLLIGRRR